MSAAPVPSAASGARSALEDRLTVVDAAGRPAHGLRWSYRLKVPLALVVAALAAGISVAATTYLLVYRYVESNATAQTQRLARTLARSLGPTLLANDVWRAFQTVRASAPAVGDAAPGVQVIVVDAQGSVFVALDAATYPLGMHATRLPLHLAAAARWVTEGTEPGAANYQQELDAPAGSVVAERIFGEEAALIGGVIVQQEAGISRQQAQAVAERLALLGSGAIAAFAIVGWIGGRRLISPLERLRAAMQEATSADVRPAVAEVSRLNDEVGDLGRAFQSMMAELDAKRELERAMLNAERMASIGRLTAAIAHEVNNPLGGMLTAIANRRLRGQVDDATERTLGLLERGLQQVHSTVAALLNEARRELHELREDDLNDLVLLLQPEAAQADCALHWRLQPPVGIALPSVPVRQVLLNLTLNAIAAAGAGGRVRVSGAVDGGQWRVAVANTGRALDPAQFAELLRGQPRSDGGRSGLGLWITARILHTLGGSLELAPPADAVGYSTELIARFPRSVPAPDNR